MNRALGTWDVSARRKDLRGRGQGRRVLVITPEPLPLPGQATTGAGLRAWGLTMGLRCRGFDAIVASCTTAFHERYRLEASSLPAHVRMFQRDRIDRLLEDVRPEVVVLQHWGMAHEVPELDVPLAIDLAGPHLLERAYWGSPDLLHDAEQKLAALRRADFVVCSGRFQRHYFYAWLALAGFDLRRTPVPIIPFSVPPLEGFPGELEREPGTFVYSGMLLAWQDPSQGLRLLLEEMDRCGRGKLVVFTGCHPVLDASAHHLAKLVDELRAHPRVEMRGIVPFDELIGALSRYDVAFDLMEQNPERELAFTTRTMIYLACGLPVIYNDFSELSESIRSTGCGWTLSPGDEAGLRLLCRRILAGEESVAPRREQAKEFARCHTWDRTIAPLADFCAAPYIREGKARAMLRVESLDHQLSEERRARQQAEAELAALRSRWIVRLANRSLLLRKAMAPLAWLAVWPISRLLRRTMLR